MSADGITLYRKVLVPASRGPGGEPVVLTSRQGKDRFYTVIEDNDHGEMLIHFDRDRQVVIERAVTLAMWDVESLFAKAEAIRYAMEVGFAP